MKVLYQSPNYRPDIITNRYLHICLSTDRPVVVETGGPHNYIYRSYELPEADYPRYSRTIQAARELSGYFPYDIELEANEL